MLSDSMMVYFNTNGIRTENPPKDGFWICEGPFDYVYGQNDLTAEIEMSLFSLRQELIKRIFGSLDQYYALLPFSTSWLSKAGLDSDIKISKEEFEILLRNADDTVRKFLYFYDIEGLIGSLQNSVSEVKHLVGEFYKELNMNDFMLATSPISPNGVMFASGQHVVHLYSTINHIFISLYTQLDYIAKICYEFQEMKDEFKSYEKMKSAKILCGDSKHLILNSKPGTLFEDRANIRIIKTLRNEIVHNSSFESISKVFQVFKNNVIVEKFIFLPDFEDGHLKSSKSRKRFFNDEVKLNELLPELIFDFWKCLKTTIDELVYLEHLRTQP